MSAAPPSPPIPIEPLRRLPIFQGMNERELQALVHVLKRRRLLPRETLFVEGSPARSAFVVAHGTVGIHKNLVGGKSERIAELGHGALLGHVALIDHRPRSATACGGEEPAWLLELQRADFERIRESCMRADWSWTGPARAYRELYAELLGPTPAPPAQA